MEQCIRLKQTDFTFRFVRLIVVSILRTWHRFIRHLAVFSLSIKSGAITPLSRVPIDIEKGSINMFRDDTVTSDGLEMNAKMCYKPIG